MKLRIVILIFTLVFSTVKAQTNLKEIDSLIEYGRYQKALQQLNKVEDSFDKNYKTALVYTSLDNYSKASNYYKKALAFKKSYKAKMKLAGSLLKENKNEEVVKLYEEICNEDSDNLIVKYALVKQYLQTRKFKKAQTVLHELIRKDESNANYYYQYALTLPKPKQIFKRIDYYLLSYKKDTLHFKSIEKLARGFTILKDHDSANVFIEKGLFLRPNHISLNRLKINDLFKNKNYNKALDLLKHIDSILPNEHYTHKMLGRIYFNLKKYTEAKKHFKNAIRLDKDDFRSSVYLGDIAYIEKKPEMAMYYYFSAKNQGKEKRDRVYMGLARVFSDMKKQRRAIESYEKAYEENPKNYKALFCYANESDMYFKDKKIGYKLYKTYQSRFEGKDSITDKFVDERLKEIKKEYFLKGEILE